MKKQVRAFITLLALILAMTAALVSCGETNTPEETTAAEIENTDASAESTEAPQVHTCNACGAIIPSNAKFCPECGADLEAETTSACEDTVVPETTKTPETASVPETTKAPETTSAFEITSAPETTRTPETTEAFHTHFWYVWNTTLNPTCTTDGVQEGLCECGEKNYLTIPASGHVEIVDNAIAPSCISIGKTEGKHCGNCDTVILAQQDIPMIDHIESDWIVDDGELKHTECTMCKMKMREEVLYAIGSVGLAYEVTSDNKSCTITGIGTCTDSKVIIPAMIEGYKVTAIAKRAFYNCTSITEITIPETVTDIGTQIFYKANNLHTVYYNSSYSSRENPFLNQPHITKVVFGGKKVPSNILSNCANIKEVEIKNTVRSIDGWAFEGCSSIKNIIIPDSVTSIGRCYELDGEYYDDISNGYTFLNCTSLVNVEIPNTVQCIGFRTFYGCTALKSVELPDSVKFIGSATFSGCISLTNITISNSLTSIGDEVFSGCSSLVSIIIPESVTRIGEKSFSKCASLTNVYISDSVTRISYNAFSGCTSLTSIIIPDSVTSIDDGAFTSCTSLESITIPDSVTTLGKHVFFDCVSLTNVTIPDSVTHIYDEMFHGCSLLTSIKFGGTKAQWDKIQKASNWNVGTGSYIIYCTDGEINK